MVEFKVGDEVEVKNRGFVVSGLSNILVNIGDKKIIKEFYYKDRQPHIRFTDNTGGYADSLLQMHTKYLKLINNTQEIILW